ncbi:MAG: DUF481 domain-containing protein [Acidobacteriia bacterium]|nr:DUF481 domain-containing protein [Terriglobia bacterium]
MRIRFLGLAAAIGLAPLLADQVTMKNGDRLTGMVLKSDLKSLTIKSEFAGTVEIAWGSVESIQSAAPLSVTLKGGEVLVGPVTTPASGKFQVKTPNAGVVDAGKESVQFIRSKEEEAVYQQAEERLRNPRLLDLWTGFVDLGLAAVRGNAKTSTFALGMNAARETKRDKITTYFTSLKSENSTAGTKVTTANAIRGGIRYDMKISRKLHGFGFTDLEFDEFQRLDLRFVGGGGMGYKVIDGERTIVDVFSGGSLNKEFFSNNTRRTSGELLFGEDVAYRMGTITQFKQRFVIYPNITTGGAYRMQFDASAVTTLSKWFSWQVSMSDRYLSNPVPGALKNDLLFTTGVRLTFNKTK